MIFFRESFTFRRVIELSVDCDFHFFSPLLCGGVAPAACTLLSCPTLESSQCCGFGLNGFAAVESVVVTVVQEITIDATFDDDRLYFGLDCDCAHFVTSFVLPAAGNHHNCWQHVYSRIQCAICQVAQRKIIYFFLWGVFDTFFAEVEGEY